jgi:hypothetical protein
MMADSVGNRDFMAVVVSKSELPWYQVNQTISSNKGNYAQAVQQALSQFDIGRLSVSRSDKGNMRFSAPAGDKGVAYAIIEINKQ